MERDWIQTKKDLDGDQVLDPDTEYVRKFNTFFTRGQMTATYKAVFLRCLLDLGKYEVHGSNNALLGSEWIEMDGDTITLDLNFVAARLIKYYWDMDNSFKLKQTANPANASIIRLVRHHHKLGKFRTPPTLEELVSSSNKTIRKKTISLVIKRYALESLLKYMPDLYDWSPTSDKITLKTNLIPFLKQHRIMIRNSINQKLVIKLESLNDKIPQIAAKVDEESYPSRTLHADATKIIENEQQHRCYYCDTFYRNKKHRHIDHVIPFNYLFSTDVYNCVAACIRCNLQKHDRLPAPALFSAVMDRNDEFEKRLSKLPKAIKRCFANYDKVWYRRTYNTCRVEYHGNAPFFSP